MKKTAIITGASGQDAAWLSQILLNNGYKVYGGLRRSSNRNLDRLIYLGILDKVELIELDLLDYSNLFGAIRDIQPDEFYNLAAMSFVQTSFKQPISTYQVDGMAVGYILDILKTISPKTKFFQASSSEMFGKVNPVDLPLNETSPFHPRSPYSVAKLFAHWATINYRESYNMFCCAAISFNHESSLRGPEFVTRKISMAAAELYHGKNKVLELGNLDAIRDWGFAKEYCQGIFQIMQQEQSDTYVLSTGKSKTVRQFVESAYQFINKEIVWDGVGENEKGYDKKTNELLIRINPEFYRPSEVNVLIGDSTKAYNKFNWKAETYVEKLASIMVESDINDKRTK